jgi:hypothetical protein
MTMHINAVSVFLSYAHEDEPLLQKLETHLSSLKRQGLISTWYDRQIIPGTDWGKVIDQRLVQATIILLLVSPSFFASDYCYQIEMQNALERHESSEAQVIPIIMRPVYWKGAPFAHLQGLPIAHLQALPTDAKAITTWDNQDEAFVDVVAGIRRAITAFPWLSASASHTALTTTWNVPYLRNPFFIGREHELERLHTRLRQSNTTAIGQMQAISGFGGIGKTQLVSEYAHRHRRDYDAIFWMRADTHEALITGFIVIAQLLHLPEQGIQDQHLVVDAVRSWLNTHERWLLILDNADEPSILGEYLPSAPRGHILLTTRAQALLGACPTRSS